MYNIYVLQSMVVVVVGLLLFLLVKTGVAADDCNDPTDGFTDVGLTKSNFKIQKPFDLPLHERYSFKNGVRKLWVYANDMPHAPDSPTQPRTEVRIHGFDYASGVWQFEGYGFIPNGTSGATVVQIHGGANHSSTIILRIYDGDLRYYSGEIIATDMYDRWFRVNLIHDVDEGVVTVYLDGEKRFETSDRGKALFYFKCGVYAAPKNISYYMESRWRDIRIYNKT